VYIYAIACAVFLVFISQFSVRVCSVTPEIRHRMFMGTSSKPWYAPRTTPAVRKSNYFI